MVKKTNKKIIKKTNKKVYQKRKTAEDIEFEKNELVKNQKSGKHMGYCPNCEAVVADLDIEGSKYECIGCNKNGPVRRLKKERENRQVWSSKREYLAKTVFEGSYCNDYYNRGVIEEKEESKSEDKEDKEV